ncbi:MAG: chemotaxis protein CheW, partial [Quisquiliibacterium sp.]
VHGGRLREFQDELADRMLQADLAQGTRRLGLQIGDRRLLVDLAQAGRVAPVPGSITPVPLARPWLVGLVNLGGSLVAVSDLQLWLGQGQTPLTKESRLLALGARLKLNAAILVTRMLGLQDTRNWPPSQSSDAAPEFLNASMTDPQGQLWDELDLALLAANPQFRSAAF